jgi:hypothetical protein
VIVGVGRIGEVFVGELGKGSSVTIWVAVAELLWVLSPGVVHPVMSKDPQSSTISILDIIISL